MSLAGIFKPAADGSVYTWYASLQPGVAGGVTSNLTLAAGYVVNKNVDLQLNLYNIFNQDDVAAINKSGYRYTPGSPRAVSLTANFRF